MRKQHIIIAVALIIIVVGVSLYLFRAPDFDAQDFTNQERVLFQQDLPQTELDLRLQETAEKEAPREGEDPLEAAIDATGDYLHAGLYGEALRVSDSLAAQFTQDPGYFEVRGDILSAMHQYRDAVEAYARALELGGDRANIFAKLGDLYLFQSDIEDRQKTARALIKHAASLTDDPEEKNELRVRAEAIQY